MASVDTAVSMAVFSWGFNKYGQLGTGDTGNREVPQFVNVGRGLVPKFVSCGAHYTLVGVDCTRKGHSIPSTKVLSCGRGMYGRLGNGSETDRHTLQTIEDPTGGYHGNGPMCMSAGHWHGCLVTSNGDLYSWGYNKTHNVCGVSHDIVFIPTHIPAVTKFTLVTCGFNYSVAVSNEGQLYSWGCGRFGVLGHGDTQNRAEPTLIKISETVRFEKVRAGYCHVGFIDTNGQLYTCGKGEEGALGHGVDKRDKLVPCVVESLLDSVITDVSCSHGERHSHTLICTQDGEVYSVGDGYKGKLGHADYKSHDVPARIDPTHFNNLKITSVACGGIHSAAMATGVVVFTWGCGSDGRLGHPEAHGHRYLFHSNVPRQVDGLGEWKPLMISCSYYHTAILCSK